MTSSNSEDAEADQGRNTDLPPKPSPDLPPKPLPDAPPRVWKIYHASLSIIAAALFAELKSLISAEPHVRKPAQLAYLQAKSLVDEAVAELTIKCITTVQSIYFQNLETGLAALRTSYADMPSTYGIFPFRVCKGQRPALQGYEGSYRGKPQLCVTAATIEDPDLRDPLPVSFRAHGFDNTELVNALAA